MRRQLQSGRYRAFNTEKEGSENEAPMRRVRGDRAIKSKEKGSENDPSIRMNGARGDPAVAIGGLAAGPGRAVGSTRSEGSDGWDPAEVLERLLAARSAPGGALATLVGGAEAAWGEMRPVGGGKLSPVAAAGTDVGASEQGEAGVGGAGGQAQTTAQREEKGSEEEKGPKGPKGKKGSEEEKGPKGKKGSEPSRGVARLPLPPHAVFSLSPERFSQWLSRPS